MRGDQLARQLQVTRAIEARPNGLSVTEMLHVMGKGFYRKTLQKPVPRAGMGFFVMGG